MAPERPLADARWLVAAESRRLLDLLEANGGAARFVGGCVRDTILDPTTDAADLDVATSLTPETVMARLGAARIQVVPTGLAHGTVTARLGERRYEITTLRHDVLTDGRRAVVRFTDDFAADAARRDFTINALFCDRSGRLYDYVDGYPDLVAGRVRFVGDPAARIREDYLRILRFFRFHARLGRGAPDRAALTACHDLRRGLARLAGERVRSELLRLVMEPGAQGSLAAMVETGVWAELVPGTPDLDRFARLLAVAPDVGPIVRLAALVRERADPAVVATRLRLGNQEARALKVLCTAPLPTPGTDAAALRRLVHTRGNALAADLLALAWADRAAPAAALGPARALAMSWTPPAFPLTGADLIARGLASGPALGRLLEELRAWWVAADFAPDRAACLAELDRRLRDPACLTTAVPADHIPPAVGG